MSNLKFAGLRTRPSEPAQVAAPQTRPSEPAQVAAPQTRPSEPAQVAAPVSVAPWRVQRNLAPASNIARLMLVFLASLLIASCSEILSPDISGKTLTVNSPADSLYTAQDVISFWWEKDESVERYQLRLTTGSAGNLTLLADTLLVANSIAYQLDPDAMYDWQVRGKNEGSETAWVSRGFIIDQTAPEKASATRMNGDTLISGNSDTLRWQSEDFPLAGNRFPVSDSLILYRRNDSTVVGATFTYAEGSEKKLGITDVAPAPLNGPGTYYWKVVTRDRAGNRKESDRFRFVVQ